MVDYTVTKIIERIRTQAGLPDNDNFLEDEDYINFLNLEIIGEITAWLMEKRQEYLLTHYDEEITSGQSVYELPYNAIGQKIKAIHVVDPENPLTPPVAVPYITHEQLANPELQGKLNGFYIENNDWYLYPEPTGPHTMRVYYYKRPNELIEPDEGGVIVSVDTNNNRFTIEGKRPTSWAEGMTLDVIRPRPPFKVVAQPTIVSISSKTITVDDVSDITVGDTVTETGYAIIPQIPFELFPILTQAGTELALTAKGDTGAAELAGKKLAEMKAALFALLVPRVDDSPKRITKMGGISSYTRLDSPWR